ncbi:Penicillin-binding protein 1A/1B [Clostridium haemolyticum]|uniref:transglycosylase domain-containing protein n=1 Tax=Clostridium haemolyticum TaxID=84025 RepID=UPI001C3C14E9|nr:transglycosylase domain-containing protein [Clostridium haemolyticum]CAG7840809.1 Penicillin-binding protein 1A/1B [Clostridium haemolyticum]
MTENKGTKSSQSKKTSSNKTNKKKFKPFKIILISILSLFIISTIVSCGLVLAVMKTAPDLDIHEIVAASDASKIYDDKGDLIDSIITSKKKILIKYDELPKDLVNAFVSIEDERFFEHKGIDLKRIAGAFLIDIKNVLKGNPGLQGASTITQQLIKNTLFETHGNTLNDKIRRKVQEWYLAPKLEKEVGKEVIMETYLNTIYLGGRAIGVGAAADQYFGISTNKLDLIQCAFIAGLPQSPSVYYPYSRTSRRDPSKYINRTKTVLSKMKENGYINENQYIKAIEELNTDKFNVTEDKSIQTLGHYIIHKPANIDEKYNFEWFTRPTIDNVKRDFKEIYNYSDDEIEKLLVNGNLKIYSTMNKNLQVETQRIINEDDKLNSLSKETKDGLKEPQASAVLTDYHTGEVKVIIGGRGEQPALSFNRATNAKVPAGSSIKPLTVYAPAIDSKIATACTVLEDSPLPDAMSKKYSSPGTVWQPKNSNGVYSGYLGLREALKNSVNVFAIKLEDKIGLNTGIKYGEKFGLTFDNVDKHSMAALALGELSNGTNTFTMANAYGVFGNNGLYSSPRLYTKVVDRNGNTILETKTRTTQVLSPESAYIMYDLLKGPVKEGTATRINNTYTNEIPIAGKTGSSTKFKNLWFCGLTPYYSGAVWIENKYGQSIYSSDAAALFGKIMNKAVEDLPVTDIKMPDNIVKAEVDRVSGLLPSDLSYKDPRGSQVYTELFIKGTVPTEQDNIHVSARVNRYNGHIAGSYTPSFLTDYRVFIKRDYTPSVYLADQMYVLPSRQDNSSYHNSSNKKHKKDKNESKQTTTLENNNINSETKNNNDKNIDTENSNSNINNNVINDDIENKKTDNKHTINVKKKSKNLKNLFKNE